MINKNIMNTLWWVMRLHAEAGRARMVSVVSVGIIAGIAEYAEAALLGMAVERLTAGGGAANVLNIALAWASISLISLLASAFLGFLADDMGMRARTLIWGSFLRKAFDAPSSFFDKAHTGRSLRIAIAGTDAAFDLWS